MTFNFKSALAVAALALGAASAQAGVTPGHITFDIWQGVGSGFTVDTGLTASTWNASVPFSVTITNAGVVAGYNSDPNASGLNTFWNVAAASATTYYTTVVSNNTATLGSGLGEGNTEQAAALSNMSAIYATVTTLTASTAADGTWAATTSQAAGNLFEQTDKAGPGSLYFGAYDANANVTLFSGTWSLTFNGPKGSATAATLTWTPTGVPLPAAVYLLGSGLLGMAGVGRRRKVVVA